MARRSADRWNATMALAGRPTTIGGVTPTIVIGYDGDVEADAVVGSGRRGHLRRRVREGRALTSGASRVPAVDGRP